MLGPGWQELVATQLIVNEVSDPITNPGNGLSQLLWSLLSSQGTGPVHSRQQEFELYHTLPFASSCSSHRKAANEEGWCLLTNGCFTELFFCHFHGNISPHEHSHFYSQFLMDDV